MKKMVIELQKPGCRLPANPRYSGRLRVPHIAPTMYRAFVRQPLEFGIHSRQYRVSPRRSL